jgi:hypothetical protein
MAEWLEQTRLTMSLCDEKLRRKRESIVLHHSTFAINKVFAQPLIHFIALRWPTMRQDISHLQHITG